MIALFRYDRWVPGLKRRFQGLMSRWFDPSSLWTQLSLGMMAIALLQWLGFALWTEWAMGQGLIVIEPSRVGRLWNQLAIGCLLFFPVILFVIYSLANYMLRPLAQLQTQLQQWTIAPQSLPTLQQFPRELRAVANRCYQLSTAVAGTQTWQRQFTTQVSHELRTPLSLVYGYLQATLRRQDNLTVVQQEALHTALLETEHTLDLLKNLLMFARSQAKIQVRDSQALDVYTLLSEAAQVAQTMTNRSIQLPVMTMPLSIWGDRELLMQMMLHLIHQVDQDRALGESIVFQLDDRSDQIMLTVPHGVRVEGQGLHLLMVQSLMVGIGGEVELFPTSQMDYDLRLRFPKF
jgi:signal transduction histidine kinase